MTEKKKQQIQIFVFKNYEQFKREHKDPWVQLSNEIERTFGENVKPNTVAKMVQRYKKTTSVESKSSDTEILTGEIGDRERLDLDHLSNELTTNSISATNNTFNTTNTQLDSFCKLREMDLVQHLKEKLDFLESDLLWINTEKLRGSHLLDITDAELQEIGVVKGVRIEILKYCSSLKPKPISSPLKLTVPSEKKIPNRLKKTIEKQNNQNIHPQPFTVQPFQLQETPNSNNQSISTSIQSQSSSHQLQFSPIINNVALQESGQFPNQDLEDKKREDSVSWSTPNTNSKGGGDENRSTFEEGLNWKIGTITAPGKRKVQESISNSKKSRINDTQ